MHNVSTAIQKKASEAMDMLQLEMRRVVGKIMECGGDNYDLISQF